MTQMKTILIAGVLLILATPSHACAQSGAFGEQFAQGALVGVGNCDAMYYGAAFGMTCNPAHAAAGETWGFSAGYRRMYGLSECDRVSASGKYTLSHGGVGISVHQFGKADFYTEFESAISAGLRVNSRITVGITGTLHRLAYTPNLPDYTGWSAGIGALYQPCKELTISAAARRLISTDFLPGYPLPECYQVSAAYSVPAVIQIGASWSTAGDNRDVIGLGQRVQLANNVRFLSALYFDPVRYALGGEVLVYGQGLTYTYLSHQDLGGTHYFVFGFGN